MFSGSTLETYAVVMLHTRWSCFIAFHLTYFLTYAQVPEPEGQAAKQDADAFANAGESQNKTHPPQDLVESTKDIEVFLKVLFQFRNSVLASTR